MRISDWSSDVCSSDLNFPEQVARNRHHAVQPPSPATSAPVTKEEASLARKTTAPLSSRGSPTRPSGNFRDRRSTKSGASAANDAAGHGTGLIVLKVGRASGTER